MEPFLKEAPLEDGFALLEQRVQKAALRLRELQGENRTLRSELQSALTRAQKAESEARAAGERAADGRHEAGRAETEELAELRRERDEVRRRIAKLVELLERLD
jgi:hypothetical protein